MNITKILTGAGIGFVAGGPVGSVIGAAAGALLPDGGVTTQPVTSPTTVATDSSGALTVTSSTGTDSSGAVTGPGGPPPTVFTTPTDSGGGTTTTTTTNNPLPATPLYDSTQVNTWIAQIKATVGAAQSDAANKGAAAQAIAQQAVSASLNAVSLQAQLASTTNQGAINSILNKIQATLNTVQNFRKEIGDISAPSSSGSGPHLVNPVGPGGHPRPPTNKPSDLSQYAHFSRFGVLADAPTTTPTTGIPADSLLMYAGLGVLGIAAVYFINRKPRRK